jgi:hypothetical protein
VDPQGLPSHRGSDQTPGEAYAAQLERTVDRLRSLAITRLSTPFEPEPTRADAARGLAQRLADVAAGLDGDGQRSLPRLADPAVGDQLAVCGRDLLAAAAAHGDHEQAEAVLVAAAADLLDLRRRL